MEQLKKFLFRRKYLSILIVIILSTSFSTILGQVDWTKYSGNPVLLPGAQGTWDDVGFPNACVLLIGTTYHMWYSGNDGSNMRIGHATSPDGINWTKDPANPVLNLGDPGRWDDYWVYFPCVIYYAGLFHMWYDGNEGPPNYYENIGHATSPDGIIWTRDPMNPVLTRGPVGSWDNLSIGPGFAYAEGSTFHLWYDGSGGTAICSGHATSTDGGTTWVKDPNNPVLNIGSPSSWDYPRAQVSSIVYNPNNATYYMYYCGGEFLLWRIGYATSDSLNGTWTKSQSNPNFTTTPSAWDSYYVGFPSVIYDGNTNNYKMWYTGNNAPGAGKIGLATSNIVSVSDEETIPTTISLEQNYPNPFNPSTTISWQSPVGSWQTIKVFDVLGNEIAILVDEYKPAGRYEVEFRPESSIKNPASGIYFYQLRVGGPETSSGQAFIETKKMLLLK